jgi:membrane protein DedA with SNARE-associated domain
VLLFTLLGKLGEALAPRLLQHAPLLLLLLNANDLLCGLAGPRLSAHAYYAAVLVRRSVEDAAFYWLGRRHADAALATLERASPGAGAAFRAAVTRLERAPVLGLAVIAVFPAAPCHIAAGAAKTSPASFAAVTLLASAVRAAALRKLGAHASPLLADALGHPALGAAAAAFATLSLALALRPLLSRTP